MTTARSIRIILVGDRPSGSFAGEIWSTGLSCVAADAGGTFVGGINENLPTFDVATIGDSETDDPWQIEWAWEGPTIMGKAMQKALAAACVTFWNAVKAYAPTDSRMTGVRINALDATNHVISGANFIDLIAPIPGTRTATEQLPAQVSVAATLRTGRRGPAGRGRMYLPLNGVTLSSGKLGSTVKNTVGAAVAAFLEDVEEVLPVPAVVNSGPQTYSAVSSVEVGDLVDIQRRRSNAVDEIYSPFTLGYV